MAGQRLRLRDCFPLVLAGEPLVAVAAPLAVLSRIEPPPTALSRTDPPPTASGVMGEPPGPAPPVVVPEECFGLAI